MNFSAVWEMPALPPPMTVGHIYFKGCSCLLTTLAHIRAVPFTEKFCWTVSGLWGQQGLCTWLCVLRMLPWVVGYDSVFLTCDSTAVVRGTHLDSLCCFDKTLLTLHFPHRLESKINQAFCIVLGPVLKSVWQ